MGIHENNRYDKAFELFNSKRGKFLIGKAIAIALKHMTKDDFRGAEDINDLTLIAENLFGNGYVAEKEVKTEIVKRIINET